MNISPAVIRVGIIGCDTSHATAFTEILNDPAGKDHVPGAKVVAAFKSFSPDMEWSRTRVDGYIAELRERHGVHITGSIAELCSGVDAVTGKCPKPNQVFGQGKVILFVDVS